MPESNRRISHRLPDSAGSAALRQDPSNHWNSHRPIHRAEKITEGGQNWDMPGLMQQIEERESSRHLHRRRLMHLAPVLRRANPAAQLLNPEPHFIPAHPRHRVPEKPPVLISLTPPQMPARTRHRKVRHPFQLHLQHLMQMPRNHPPHAILLRQLMQREMRILKHRIYQPRRPVKHDELHRLIFVRF